ncbi:PP0621 family protein [Undibacterium pigrum]|uniref:Uncharacterized protein n=1 Tax=Undibacterium pigrum TaxID=401470 RepID=A0A318J7D1_9BURK|nr:PP0621 family protein [Undibacterium pigrum]PXX43955.1 uncharacterized protein DFR42_103223 [Undibacterium pigrum]
MRMLFWLGLLVLIILALKKKMQPPKRPVATSTSTDTHPHSASSAETMVCCAHCQIYLPASEAVQRGEQMYCSKEHADLA